MRVPVVSLSEHHHSSPLLLTLLLAVASSSSSLFWKTVNSSSESSSLVLLEKKTNTKKPYYDSSSPFEPAIKKRQVDVTISLLPYSSAPRAKKKKDGNGEAVVHQYNKYPLVISPGNDRSLNFLSDFMEEHREWLDKQIAKYGAILFRGFDIDTTLNVETAVRAFEPNLNDQYRGTSPRSSQGESDYVFSAAEVPSHYPIAQHLEMSFLPSPPRRLFFSALKPPKALGGETSLADFRGVYRDLPDTLRKKLATKKLLYTRTQHKKGARNTFDVASMKSWSDIFGTTDKNEVERIARKEGTPMRWTGRNNDTYVSEFLSEPFQLHPDTRVPVYFNHIQVFHWTTFPAELFHAFKRTKNLKFLARAINVGFISVVKYGILRHKMALHVSYGDGTPISVGEMHQIRKAIYDNMVYSRWQKGDLLLIDNFSTSHGRQPTYDKDRRIVVAWSDPIDKANEKVE